MDESELEVEMSRGSRNREEEGLRGEERPSIMKAFKARQDV